MTNDNVNRPSPEVNSESSVSGENSSGKVVPIKPSNSKAARKSGVLIFALELCDRLGLQYKSGNLAFEPLPGGGRAYGHGRRVTIQRDGHFEYSDGRPYSRQPTDEERERIASEYESLLAERVPVPGGVNLKIHPFQVRAEGPLPENIKSRALFFYHPEAREGIIAHEWASMVVVRDDFTEEYIREKGLEGGNRKRCVAWVPYQDDDGVVWRPALPARGSSWKTPLYMRGTGRPNRYMVHEGEKTVDAAVAHSRPGSGHRLQAILAQFTHVTWQGGALKSSVHQADWSIIDRPGAKIVVVPDADNPAFEEAGNVLPLLLVQAEDVRVVHWRGMRMNRDRRPGESGWDIADPIPTEHGKPILNEAIFLKLMRRHMPAFTSREYTAVDRHGNPVVKIAYDIRPDFVRGYVRSGTKKTEIIDREDPNRRYTFESFDSNMCHCDNRGLLGKNMSKVMVDSGSLDEIDGFGIRAGGTVTEDGSWELPPVGLYLSKEGDRLLNTYTRPTLVEKAPPPVPAKPGDDGRVRGFTGATSGPKWLSTSAIRAMLLDSRRLIPNPRERKNQVRLECNLLAARNRDEFVEWGCILASRTQGTGKTTRVEHVSTLLGAGNCFLGLRPVDVVGEKNAALNGKRMISLEEIKEDEKNPITEPAKNLTNANRVDRRMYADPSKASDTMLTIFGLSNHPDYVLRLDPHEEDRRWHIPTITEEAGVPPCLRGMMARYFGWTPNEGDSGFFAKRQRVFDESAAAILWFMRRYGRKCLEVPRVWKRPARNGAPGSEAANFVPKVSEAEASSHSFVPVFGTWNVAFRKAPLTEAKLRLMASNRHGGEVKLEEAVGDSEIVVLQDAEAWAKDLRPPLPRKRIEDWLEATGFYRAYVKPEGSKNAKQGRVKFGTKPPAGRPDTRTMVNVYIREGSSTAVLEPADAIREWAPMSEAWKAKKELEYAPF